MRQQPCRRLRHNPRPLSFLDCYERQHQIAKSHNRCTASRPGEYECDLLRQRHALSRGYQGPMTNANAAADLRDRRGFTIIELIVSFVIGLIVLSSVVQMMIVQAKGYRKQREQVDVRETRSEEH